MGSVTTRDEALHLRAEARRTCGWAWASARNDVELVLRALPSLALRYAAQDRAGARARRVVARPAPRSRRCCIRRCRARPATSTGGASAARRPGLFSVVFDARFDARAGRRLRRCAAAVQDRLFVGRPGQPRRALRPRPLRGAARAGGHAGALLGRSRGRRRPDRGLRAGARRAGRLRAAWRPTADVLQRLSA